MKRNLVELIHDAGLDRVSKELQAVARSAIGVKTASARDNRIPVGASKLGGRPDLPPGIMWPSWNGTPLDFIAQFRLSDVARYDAEQLLPQRGMIYFFYDAEQQPWGSNPDERSSWRACFYDSQRSLNRMSQRAASIEPELAAQNKRPLPVRSIFFSREITLPNAMSPAIDRLSLSNQERDGYYQLLREIDRLHHRSEQSIHRLLGHPAQIQNEMELGCQLASNGYRAEALTFDTWKQFQKSDLVKLAADWRLLLQLDSELWISGDCGRIYFWIRKQDLQARAFGNVWLALQCH